jgi:hypothetical protein
MLDTQRQLHTVTAFRCLPIAETSGLYGKEMTINFSILCSQQNLYDNTIAVCTVLNS